MRSPHVDRLSLAKHLDLLLGQGLARNRQVPTRRLRLLLPLLFRLQLLQDSCDLRTLFVRVVADPLDHRLPEAVLFDPLRQAAIAELPIHLRSLERMSLQGEGHTLDLLRRITAPMDKGRGDLLFGQFFGECCPGGAVGQQFPQVVVNAVAQLFRAVQPLRSDLLLTVREGQPVL